MKNNNSIKLKNEWVFNFLSNEISSQKRSIGSSNVETIKRKKSRQKNTLGSILAECCLIVPVILYVTFLGADLVRYVKYTQIVAALNREASSQAIKNCVGDRGDKLRLCLNRVRDDILSYAGNLVSQPQLIVSYYEYNDASNNFKTATHSDISVGNYSSKYSVVGATLSGLNNQAILRNHPVIVISEVYARFRQWTPGLGAFVTLTNGVYYDAAIL